MASLVKVGLYTAAALGTLGAGVLGIDLLSKAAGGDQRFNRALMTNLMFHQGGFGKTYWDGFTPTGMMLGREGKAYMDAQMYSPYGSHLMGHPWMMRQNMYYGSPHMMGHMPFHPMMLGNHLWHHRGVI